MAKESVNEGLGRGQSDVPASEFSADSLKARQDSARESAEAEGMKLAQEIAERRTVAPGVDESRRSTESIRREVADWSPDSSGDRSVAAGLTTDVEPLADEPEDVGVERNRQLGLPDDATFADRQRVYREHVEQAPPPPPSTVETELLTERFQNAWESAPDEDEILATAVNLAKRNPQALAEELARLHEDEIGERTDELEYTGSGEDFAENAEWLNEPTEAQELGQRVFAALNEIERQTTQAALAEARAKEAAASELLMGEVIVRELGSNNPDELEARLSGLHGVATTVAKMDSSEAINFVQGDVELAVQLQQGLWGIPPDDPIFQQNVRAFREIDRQLHAANAKARLAESFGGTGTSVADGLRAGNPTERMVAAFEETEERSAINPRLVRRAMAEGSIDRRRPEEKLRSQSAAEVKESIRAPDTRSVADGLTDSRGKKTSVADAIARGQGYKSAKHKADEEDRQRLLRAHALPGS